MPARIRRDPITNRPVVVITPEAPKRERPRGMMFRDPDTGRMRARTPTPDPRFIVGVDLGQTNDYTAIVALTRDPEDPSCFHVPTVERLRGLPYPRLVAGLVATLAEPPFAGDFELVMDATGVGLPVVEMVREAGLDPIALKITGADKVKRGRRAVTVPKADLIEGLLVASQNGKLKIASGATQRVVLVEELADMRRTLTVTGHARYEARKGQHDDLVVALAMAYWRASRPRRRGPSLDVSVIVGDAPDRSNDWVRQRLADAVR